MAAHSNNTLGSIGEEQLIREIRRWLGPACPPSPAGIGDDCAVLPAINGKALITVDPVIRGKHFDHATPPARVAAKLLRRNLSDIAAMGGIPKHAVVALAAPADTSIKWIRTFYRALGREAVRFGVSIVGGDCTETDTTLGAFLTLTGAAPKRPLLRTGGRAGDRIYVTGTLGGSLLGRHLRFVPRLEEGQWLARQSAVRAAIDLSDGLGKDLPCLLPENCAASIDSRRLPVSAGAREIASQTGRDPIDHVINDGEDYELLFIVAAAAGKIEQKWKRRFSTRLTCIGQLHSRRKAGARIVWKFGKSVNFEVRGYEHFR
jgi:thiamine-monophosphate kinase